MMSAPLDELYLKWLYEQVAVASLEDRDLTYWKVLKILFTKEFIWVVENDENRIHDGLALRHKFLEESDIHEVDPDWMETGCSFLELMVGLSRRLEEEASKGRAHYWFWILMSNIGLEGYSDERRFTRRVIEKIEHILDTIIHRNYEPSGLGGFFPLKQTRYNQRKRELWYQMNEYLLERGLAW